MLLLAFSVFANTISSVLAAPATTHVVVEKRDAAPPGWVATHKLDAGSVLPIRIGLTQSNLDKLEDYIMDVSAPDSPNWGRHWTPAQIAKAFAPSAESIDAVRGWLASAGIAAERIKPSGSHGWLNLNATVAEAEELLRTDYHMYEHESGTRQVGCKQYMVPEAIRKHIDIITPTVHFDAKIRARGPALAKRALPESTTEMDMGHSPVAKQGQSFPSTGALGKKLANCTGYITPACLRALYEIPLVTTNTQNNPLGIVEYTPQSYYQPDLTLFFNTYSKKQKQTTPNLASVDGGFVNDVSLGFDGNGESNLDLEYAMTLANPITTTVFIVGDDVEGASFDNFLDAIDASYCTFEGGDNPNYDAKYPDPYDNYTGAFEGPENCGGFKAPKVISTSYAYSTEYDLSIAYQQRQCAEYAKLGLAGTSVLYSSGDTGVATSGTSAKCLAPNSTFGHPHFEVAPTSRFTVSFPGNCPYVTGVGATEVKNNTSILSANPEAAANVLLPQGGGVNFDFSSGGGFSDVFPIPKYQKAAMKYYFANHEPSYSGLRYNNSGQARGVPDVSANGANYVITVNGTFSLVYGTSASCPTFASIVSIINEQRKQDGKGSIGFLNPMLYANPEVLTDITQGRNPGCGTQGFKAVTGWDPLTGLGTPNVPRMLELFLKMA